MIPILDATDASLERMFARGWRVDPQVAARVAEILQDVQARGDDALLAYTRMYDTPKIEHPVLRVVAPPRDAARAVLPADVAHAIELAVQRVERFHERQLRADIDYREDDGTTYAFRSRPLQSVAVYVPGGTAVLPSSVIMGAVPAKVAGVERTIVLTPPATDGTINAAILFAAACCGVNEIYAVGGAQAIAAAAYGTQSIAPVDKIVGPGNVYVTEAKRQVFGICGIDGLAGPSEVLVIADESADAAYVAGELLAQAEHDALARVAAISTDRALLEAVGKHIDATLQSDERRAAMLREVMSNGAWLVAARDRAQCIAFAQRFAPEHLSLQVRDPQPYIDGIRTAGAIFVGAMTPVAAGDYILGTNHVLPTSGAARFSSGLSTADFQRTFAVVANSDARMRADAPHIVALAQFEGLPHHADAARMRE